MDFWWELRGRLLLYKWKIHSFANNYWWILRKMYFSKFYGKVGIISWLFFHLIWKKLRIILKLYDWKITSQPAASINNRPNLTRRPSEDSITSGVVDAQQFHTINVLKPKWWGGRRIDYALYCPEGLSNFPTNSLPHLFHSSYWESADVISFVLRQLVRAHDIGLASTNDLLGGGGLNHPMGAAGGSLDLLSQQPREKWIKKRTSVKIRQGAPNHRYI